MIICHSKKFIFLKGKKTGGSSIQNSLMRMLTAGDIVTGSTMEAIKEGVYPPDWQRSVFWLRPMDLLHSAPRNSAYRRFLKSRLGISTGPIEHIHANKIKEYVGNTVWSEYFKFTFERNPFDRMISFYFWRIRDLKQKPSFEQFINALYVKDIQFLKHYNLSGRYSNLPYYLIDDDIAVDFVGQYDNLVPDLEFVYEKIGIKFDGWLPKLKNGTRPRGIRYSDVANEEITDKMKIIFAKEISLFGYKVPGH